MIVGRTYDLFPAQLVVSSHVSPGHTARDSRLRTGRSWEGCVDCLSTTSIPSALGPNEDMSPGDQGWDHDHQIRQSDCVNRRFGHWAGAFRVRPGSVHGSAHSSHPPSFPSYREPSYCADDPWREEESECRRSDRSRAMNWRGGV